jgi:acetylornithine deacetylase/succinyl-diaminopimelate desuccinylase-like protein
MIRGGEKVNVLPSEVRVTLDGRMLPGMKPDQFVEEVREIIGMGEEDVEIKVAAYEAGTEDIDMGLYEQLSASLKKQDPDGVPVPMLMTAVTDGRYLAQLGIQSYGFIPMKLPDGFEYYNLVHNANERIPVEAVEFGTKAIYDVLKEYRD